MSLLTRPRVRLAHLPTPLEDGSRLLAAIAEHHGIGAGDARLAGTRLWIKRDDASGGPEAGNKIRKLEFLVADAEAKGATALITCGGLQSNHARATAVVARRRGLGCVLLLRTTGSLRLEEAPRTGNLLLDRLLGADVRLITPADYRARLEKMSEVAEELRARGERGYVIVEGGSDALGSFGYVEAMAELDAQRTALGEEPFDAVVLACGSGGTAAGAALGAGHTGVARAVWAMAVCDDVAYFSGLTERLIAEMRAQEPTLGAPAGLSIRDEDKGPAYGVASEEQLRLIANVARRSGVLLDPSYTGKAVSGLGSALARGELANKRVIFLHTGGLPGLLAQADSLPLTSLS